MSTDQAHAIITAVDPHDLPSVACGACCVALAELLRRVELLEEECALRRLQDSGVRA